MAPKIDLHLLADGCPQQPPPTDDQRRPLAADRHRSTPEGSLRHNLTAALFVRMRLVPPLVVLLLLAGCGTQTPGGSSGGAPLTPTVTHQSWNGRLVFKGFLTADFSMGAIFSAEPDGTVKQLTHPDPTFSDDYPDWSPDGSKIVFTRCCFPMGEIMTMNADGTSLRQVGTDLCTGTCFGNDEPSWSPDGRKIAFVQVIGPEKPDGNATNLGVWIMNADGTNPVRITQFQTPTSTEDHEPSWSPDGKQIVFTRLNTTAEPFHAQALFVMNVDGTDLRRITPWELNAGDANWSPNGKLIIFQSDRNCCLQIYTIHPDGTDLNQLTSVELNEDPYWSPDGAKIVFARHQLHHDAAIFVMNADGSGVVQVTNPVHYQSEPSWGNPPSGHSS